MQACDVVQLELLIACHGVYVAQRVQRWRGKADVICDVSVVRASAGMLQVNGALDKS